MTSPRAREVPPLPVLAMTLARAAVPLWGVFVQDWSASRQLLMYWIDTGMSLVGAFSVVLLRFLPRPDSASELVNTVGGALLGGLFLAAVTMPVLGLPLLFHAPLATFARLAVSDPAFSKALITHAGVLCVMMIWVYADRDVCAREASQARDRFVFAFVRWIATYLVLVSPLATVSGWSLRIAVLAYIALGVWQELAPHRLHAWIDRVMPPAR